jgi:signal transduction histidine kinase/ligand-binding sensor domain-containing protein
MGFGPERGRGIVEMIAMTLGPRVRLLLRSAAVAAVLVASSISAEPIPDFQHTSWSIADGAPPNILALAQTPDGYLWLGSGDGLFRFDGVRFERYVPAGANFPHSAISALESTPSGDLLIGYLKGGVSKLSKGVLRNLTDYPRSPVVRIIQDADGNIWVHSRTLFSRGGLLVLSHGRWRSFMAGLPAESGIDTMMLDDTQTLRIEAGGTFYELPRGQPRFRRLVANPFPSSPMRRDGYVGGMPMAPDSSIWFVDDRSFGRLLPGPVDRRPPPSPRRGARAIFDSHGDIWLSSRDKGVQRIPAVMQRGREGQRGERQIFGSLDGLTSNSIGTILEDKERNVWIGTDMGLDRFEPANVVREGSIPALGREITSIQAAPGGNLYVVQAATLNLLQPGRGLTRLTPARALGGPDLAFCAGKNLSVWFAKRDGFVNLSGRSIRHVDLPEGVASSDVVNCAVDVAGRLWMAAVGKGLYRRDPREWRAFADIGPFDNSALLAADDDGAMWALLDGGPMRRIMGDRSQTFDRGSGLSIGDIEVLYKGAHGLLVGGETGLAEFDGRRFRSVETAIDSPFRRIAGIAQTRAGETWLNTVKGVVELSTDDLEASFRSGRWPKRYRLFDKQDGLVGSVKQDSQHQTTIEDTDGRLWFVTNQGVFRIDPETLFRNVVSPPVSVQRVIADGRSYSNLSDLELPPGTSTVEIDYTALSLRASEHVAFRYRLDGVDKDWVNPGHRRQAFYTRLGAGTFTFRVIAANDSGIWNRDGAVLTFKVRPTMTESWTFRAACAVLVLLLVAGLMALNIRRIAARLRERLDERLRERERIARELHDTLLQGFQGLQLHFHSVAETLPPQSPTRGTLDRALAMADGALVDARQRVRELRASGMRADLPQHLRAKGESLIGEPSPALKIVEVGVPRELDPTVEREVAAVAEEAMFNAIKHANAKTIEVRIGYSRRRLQVTISDDGSGVDPDLVAKAAGAHFGLLGMRERVRRLRGTFAIGDRPGGGTEVKLSIPGPVAYGTVGWLLGRFLPSV